MPADLLNLSGVSLKSLKAIVYKKYGPPSVLQYLEVEKPTPKDHEVLIEVRAATVTAGDCELRNFSLPFSIWWLPVRLYMGLFKPRHQILGQELSGEVVEVGKEVTKFKPGDQLIAATSMKMGAYAQYICLPEKGALIKKPATLNFQSAATVPTGGLNGLHFVRKAKIQPGEKVLIAGAGGSIGTYGLQIAKSLGAKVTCVDREEKHEMLMNLGADHVIDYTREGFTNQESTYDVIIEVAGKYAYRKCLKCLNPKGRLIIGNPELTWLILGAIINGFTNKSVINALAGYKLENLNYLAELLANGDLRSAIDKVYRLDQMQEAHEYVEAGLKKGNVVIDLRSEI